eukprot:GHVQ01037423.1.p1 GENE.GHVQ01037423.1~~GHVQ01037423.1.p1  ORF type:complete len:324 (+),score=30.56 GHVQ01037423.1:614-1585(+)
MAGENRAVTIAATHNIRAGPAVAAVPPEVAVPMSTSLATVGHVQCSSSSIASPRSFSLSSPILLILLRLIPTHPPPPHLKHNGPSLLDILSWLWWWSLCLASMSYIPVCGAGYSNVVLMKTSDTIRSGASLSQAHSPASAAMGTDNACHDFFCDRRFDVLSEGTHKLATVVDRSQMKQSSTNDLQIDVHPANRTSTNEPTKDATYTTDDSSSNSINTATAAPYTCTSRRCPYTAAGNRVHSPSQGRGSGTKRQSRTAGRVDNGLEDSLSLSIYFQNGGGGCGVVWSVAEVSFLFTVFLFEVVILVRGISMSNLTMIAELVLTV